MLDRALQRRVRLSQLQDVHQRNLGCHGSKAAGKLLIVAADGAAAISERLLMRLLRDAGIAGWRVNHPLLIGGAMIRPDFVFLREGIVLEVDGWAWHHAPDLFQRDRARQNALISAGGVVLRFTWLDLTNDPAGGDPSGPGCAVEARRFGPFVVAEPLRMWTEPVLPLTMITDELLPIAAAHGLKTDRVGLTGWSMGGYGALLMGQQLGPDRISTVAAVSPAIFADYPSSSSGSFDSEADFRANDPRRSPTKLAGINVLIDCGTDDPFAPQASQLRSSISPTPAGRMARGAHTGRYMRRVSPEQMAFLGEHLHAG